MQWTLCSENRKSGIKKLPPTRVADAQLLFQNQESSNIVYGR